MLQPKAHGAAFVALLLVSTGIHQARCYSLSSSSVFHGTPLQQQHQQATATRSPSASFLDMRKQKASDRRTRRLQRGDIAYAEELAKSTQHVGAVTSSPMSGKAWRHKRLQPEKQQRGSTGGRGRSRKRSALYNSLSMYHNKFLSLLTEEYKQEEEEVLSRIKASIDDPLGYEAAGFALFDLYPERRGNLYSDEVYRLVKAFDATTTFAESVSLDSSNSNKKVKDDIDGDASQPRKEERYLPPNHKFSSNDVIMLTLQPQGSGDFFNVASLPTTGVAMEARVLNSGPTYVDVALPSGSFEAAFGPAPNNAGPSGRGDSKMRLRADQFFSNIPYQRMVTALSQLTAVPDRQQQQPASQQVGGGDNNSKSKDSHAHERICMDELLREVILSTHSYSEPLSPYYGDKDFCDLEYLASSLAKPPMGSSQQLAKKALSYIRSNDQQIFEKFNEPQLGAINAALTRRLTMIQGPPGTGKTSVASAIGFGFALQCRSLSASGNAKVLATACSNVGADNLADRLLTLGLKVVRIGRPSAVSEALWDHTLDAHIDRDPDAQSALEHAARATAALKASRSSKNGSKGKTTANISMDLSRDLATAAVKASIQACNIAATKALREADIIVSTSTGASDPRLLAACGISTDSNEDVDASGRVRNTEGGSSSRSPKSQSDRLNFAPDGLPPLSCPFVIIDESCQSVEPASLVPIVSTNSCRSVTLLGDPCQLPPTVRSGDNDSPLAVSLMSRLASTLPHPIVGGKQIRSKDFNTQYLNSLPIKQARSHFHSMGSEEKQQESYRKRYSGSILLTVQYRMHPSISALPSAIFYDGLLATPSFLSNARQFPRVFSASMPCDDNELCVRMVDVGGRSNERQGALKGYSKAMTGPQSAFFGEKQQTSYWNLQEAKSVVALVKEAVASTVGDPSSPRSIGIVTPYTAQVDLIKRKLAEDKDLMSSLEKLAVEIEVKTVDGYQGRERDLIIFSAVRSNRKGNIGFLRDWRRMNVALTRSKSGLIVVGDLETLADGDKHWAAFLKWCSEVGCIFPGRNLV